MDLKRKLELVTQAVKSVSMHDDLDAAVRLAALAQIEAIVQRERETIEKRTAASIKAALSERIS